MGVLSLIEALYENFRKTDTKVESNKPEKRNYNFDAGFTGTRKGDYKPSVASKTKTKKTEDKELDER